MDLSGPCDPDARILELVPGVHMSIVQVVGFRLCQHSIVLISLDAYPVVPPVQQELMSLKREHAATRSGYDAA